MQSQDDKIWAVGIALYTKPLRIRRDVMPRGIMCLSSRGRLPNRLAAGFFFQLINLRSSWERKTIYIWKLQKYVRESCAFVFGGLCLWHHEHGRPVCHKCWLHLEPAFFCSLFMKREPEWLDLQESGWKAKGYFWGKLTEEPHKVCKGKHLLTFCFQANLCLDFNTVTVSQVVGQGCRLTAWVWAKWLDISLMLARTFNCFS